MAIPVEELVAGKGKPQFQEMGFWGLEKP